MEQATTQTARAPRYRRNKKQAALLILILSILLLGIGWALVAWLKGLVLARMVHIEQVRKDWLEATCQVQALVIRNETIITAPAVGRFEPEAPEGKRVASGAALGRFIPAGSGQGSGPYTLAAPRAGLVYYQADGLEGALGSGHLQGLDLDKLDTLKEEASPPTNKTVDRGTPLVRIVDNMAPVYLYVTLDLGVFPEPLTQGSKVELYLYEPQEPATGRWARLQGTGQQVRALIALDKPMPVIWETRRIPVRLVTNIYSGIILPQTALVEKEGTPGVYRLDKRQIQWIPVTVVGQVGDRVAVDGLESGSEIITNPRVAFEGQKLP